MHCGLEISINILIYDNNARDWRLEPKKTIDCLAFVLFQLPFCIAKLTSNGRLSSLFCPTQDDKILFREKKNAAETTDDKKGVSEAFLFFRDRILSAFNR